MRTDTALLDAAPGARAPRRVRIYAWSLLAVAVGALVALVAGGAELPSAGAVLLLAVPMALVVNRFLFFPNETGFTADAAVLFAAILVFRDDAVYVGPLVLALLVGPLDAHHLEERAFVRMAFNAGSQSVVTLAAAATFVLGRDAWGSSAPALLGATAVAGLVYVVVEAALAVGLLALFGEPARRAARHQVPLHFLALPLALYGALAGWCAGSPGWWLTLVLLLPVPLVPELVLVEVPRRWRARSLVRAWGVMLAVVLLVGLAVGLPDPEPGTFVALLAIALVVGGESRVASRHPVPLLAAATVVAALAVVPGDARYLAAGSVALAVVLSAWSGARRAPPSVVPILAPVAALLAALGWSLVDTTPASARGVLVLLAIGLVCVLIAERRPSIVAWCAPVLAATVALAALWDVHGDGGGAVVFAVGLACTLVGSAAWGAAVWRSRVLGPWASRWSPRVHSALLRAAAIGAVACAVVARDHAWKLGAIACAEAATAMSMAGVRQWRFAPRARLRDCALLDAVAVALLGSVSLRATSWEFVAVLVALLAVTVVVGARLIGRSRAPTGTDDRTDVELHG